MNLPEQKSIRGLTSPSNLAIAMLVGFLCVGYVTDWKILRGRPLQSALAAPGLPKRMTEPLASQWRSVGPNNRESITLKADPQSEFADRRAVNYDAKNRSELD